MSIRSLLGLCEHRWKPTGRCLEKSVGHGQGFGVKIVTGYVDVRECEKCGAIRVWSVSTDTPERELIERLRSPRHSGSGIEDTLLEAADTIEALLSRVDKLEEEIAKAMQGARDEIGATEQQRIAFAYAEAAMRSVLNRSAS